MIKRPVKYKTRAGRKTAFLAMFPFAVLAMVLVWLVAQVWEAVRGAWIYAREVRREVPLRSDVKEIWRGRKAVYAGT